MKLRKDKSGAGASRITFLTPLLVAAAVTLATILPLAYYFKKFPLYGPLSFDVGDTFYYLTVARTSLHLPFFSFDGAHPTNGFHPAWQILLMESMLHGLLSATDVIKTINRLAELNLLLLGLASGAFALFMAKQLRRPWIAAVAVCPGLLWFVGAPGAAPYIANWSFCNGMETSLELFFFSMAILALPRCMGSQFDEGADYEVDKRTEFRLILSGLLFGCMVLSRLDDVFYLLPLGLLSWKLFGRKVRAATLTAIGLPLLMILVYVTYNRLTVGVYLPTSGAAKAGLALAENLSASFHSLLLLRFHESPLHPLTGGYREIFERLFQMIAPLLVCGYYIWKRHRDLGVVHALCAGVLLKGMYNLVLVEVYNQGPWYYGVSIFVSNMVIALELDKLLNRANDHTAVSWRSGTIAIASYAVLVAYCSTIFLNQVAGSGEGQELGSIVVARQQIKDMVSAAGSDRFIEMNDGELTYVTGMPALSGIGLALDHEAADARKQGRFLELARQRGFGVILAVGGYRDEMNEVISELRMGTHPAQFGMRAQEFDHVTLEPVGDGSSGAQLYRIVPLTQP